MLYALDGHAVPNTGDLYAIHSVSRNLAKNIFIIMLNADDDKAAYKAIRRDHPKDIDKRTWDQAVMEIRKKHSPIAKHFFTGIGTKLQADDSNMAEIILDIINQQGIVTLPIHDSFIIRSSFEEELEMAMEFAANVLFPQYETRLTTEFLESTGDGQVTDSLVDIIKNNDAYFKEIDNQRKHADYLPFHPSIWIRTKWTLEPNEENYIYSLGIYESQRTTGRQIISYLDKCRDKTVDVGTLIDNLDIPYGGTSLAEILVYTYHNIFNWIVDSDTYQRWSLDHTVNQDDLFSKSI